MDNKDFKVGDYVNVEFRDSIRPGKIEWIFDRPEGKYRVKMLDRFEFDIFGFSYHFVHEDRVTAMSNSELLLWMFQK